MKTLLLFVILITWNAMSYGQWAETNKPTYNSIRPFNSIETYMTTDDLNNEVQMQSAFQMQERDSIEWYANYEARLQAIKIYPNPAHGQIHVDGLENSNNELWILQLMDLDGRLIYNTKLDPNQRNINLTDVSMGNYIIRFVRGYEAYPFRITLY